MLSYWAHPDGEAGVRVSELTGAPCAVIIGGSDVLILPNSPARKQSVVNVLKNSDSVITISQGLAEVVKGFGVSELLINVGFVFRNASQRIILISSGVSGVGVGKGIGTCSVIKGLKKIFEYIYPQY